MMPDFHSFARRFASCEPAPLRVGRICAASQRQKAPLPLQQGTRPPIRRACPAYLCCLPIGRRVANTAAPTPASSAASIVIPTRSQGTSATKTRVRESTA